MVLADVRLGDYQRADDVGVLVVAVGAARRDHPRVFHANRDDGTPVH